MAARPRRAGRRRVHDCDGPGAGSCPAAAAARTTGSTPAAAACVAALQGDSRPLQAEGHADALAVLDERRVNLSQSRVRAVNQLHALLRALHRRAGHLRTCPLLPPPRCCAQSGPAGVVEQARKSVVKDLVVDIRSLDTQLKLNTRAIAELVAAAGGTLDPNGWGRAHHGGPADQQDRTGQPLPHLLSLRELFRRGTGRDRQRRQEPPPTLPARGPPAELRPPHHRHHPDPHAQQPRPPLLHQQARRRKDPTRSSPMPEEAARRPHLANHDQRRTARNGPGRTPGTTLQSSVADPTPNHQLFGQVTSRTRHSRCYDSPIRAA